MNTNGTAQICTWSLERLYLHISTLDNIVVEIQLAGDKINICNIFTVPSKPPKYFLHNNMQITD